MLKHTQLTLGRVERLRGQSISPFLTPETQALQIEFCPVGHKDEATARKKGPWQVVEKGHRYGPAYQVFWFRVTGKVPKEWAGKKVGLRAEVGGERTLWVDNVPFHGIDGPHAVVPVLESAKGGEKIDLAILSHASNAQTTVHGAEKPRDPLPDKVDFAELVTIDPVAHQLDYDFDFALSLLKVYDEDHPVHAATLRALNDVCNLAAADPTGYMPKARRRLREAFQGLEGGAAHTITPVGHAHLDTAWLWPLHVTHLKMAHTTATQLELIRRYPEYVFAHSQASQYEWLESEYPKLFEKVKDAIAKGQWEPVGSMWVEADCNLSGGEALIRQFLYGRRYFRSKLGYETEDMWLPDVFGYSAAIPQILAGFGIQYFMTQKMSWNQVNKFPHNTFWWQGIDGTKVWAHFPPANTYNSMATPEEIVRSVKNHKDHARSDRSLLLFGYGDGGGGPTERMIELLRRGRATNAMPELESGKPAVHFFRKAKEESHDLAVWAGELYLEYHRGTYTTQAANKKANRECEFLLRDAELLASFAPGYPKGYPAKALEDAWKLVLLNQFHDIIPGSSVREVYEDSAIDYDKVREAGAKVIEDSLRAIAERQDLGGRQRPVALFQNATTSSEGSIPWEDEEVPGSIRCGDETLPVQLVEAFGERKLTFQTPAEALGAVAVADLRKEAVGPPRRLKVSGRKLENDWLSVRFDSNGNIASIRSLEDQPVEFIEPGKLANVFQLLDDKPLFWSAWDVDVYAFETAQDLLKAESFEVVERGPVRVAVESVRSFGKSTIRQRISLGPTPGIRFDTEIDWHETDKMLKVAFPLNVNATHATYEIQYGHVQRPTHSNTTWDMAQFEVCAQKWADLSEGGQGVALLNDGKYGHDIHGNVMRLSLLRSPKAPDPIADMGKHRFSYVLLPHFDGFMHGDVVSAAYALNSPLRHAWPSKGAGHEALGKLFSIDNRNLIIESVKKAEDSDMLVVRLYECHNTRGYANLTCAKGIKRALKANLEEVPIEELEVTQGAAHLTYRPFEIITLLVETER